MKKLAMGLICALPIVLFGRVAYLILFTSSPDAGALDHAFRQAAYTITWAIQLGYVAWLCLKRQTQKRSEEPTGSLTDRERSSLQ